MTRRDGCHPDVWANLGCCYFFLGMYPEADEAGSKGKIRIVYARRLENINRAV
jgi:hypothetical protein